MEDRFEAKYPKDSWKDEVDQIVKFVKSGNSCQLISFPGVGRSNLLGLLAYNRAARQLHLGVEEYKNFHFVLMNFTEMRGQDLSEVFKFFFISILDSLKEREMDEEYKKIQSIFKESVEIADKQVLLQGLKKAVDYLAIEKKLTIIFLIDRFEEYVPYLTPEFFTSLRALRNRAKYKFSVVFSVDRPFEEVMDPIIYHDYYEILEGNTIYLSLKDEKSLEFRVEFLEKNAHKKISEDAVNEIFKLTSGHGKLARLSIEAYLSEEPKGNLLEFLLSNKKVKGVLLEIWKSLTPQEQNAVKTKNFDNQDFLKKTGLVADNKIAILLLEKLIETQKQELSTLSEGKIVFDPNTNEIKKGQIVLSDGLTSSELKLLKYLVNNPEKILERDDVVSAVWGELSSTAGVSEQALDQLIFRVRKKIEENPNSPTHIQTVKGRGLKFTS